eukprot:CAMPEP_0197072876 /NCGR_PEP_ID=MMETSP1384-20130603/210316_1 /TAXON_ID=29189 /ORGANISM="Ammonia sp." /LENGTH=331 /DNA_ID=CAMNT_0042511697 /DNA_START=65 /DNA_END=1057 /DNA_ORIENTATION=+
MSASLVLMTICAATQLNADKDILSSTTTISQQRSTCTVCTEQQPHYKLFNPSTGTRSESFYNHMLHIIDDSLALPPSNTADRFPPHLDHNQSVSAYAAFGSCLAAHRDGLQVKDLKDIYRHMLHIIDDSLSLPSSNTAHTFPSHLDHNQSVSAYAAFGSCLAAHRDGLQVKDLKDIYRIRGIPKSCCASFANAVLPSQVMEQYHAMDNGSNCRINSFFVPTGGFDLHTHPLYFSSLIVSGGYTHSYWTKRPDDRETTGLCLRCEPLFDEVCAEQNRIYRKDFSLPLEYHGTKKLHLSYKQSFNEGDLVTFTENQAIHIIDEYLIDTVTVNW